MLITRKQYDALADTEITEGSSEIESLLGESNLGTYAQYGSWAIWPDVSVKPVATSQDKSVVNKFSAVEGTAHSNVVLVAYNLGRPASPSHGAGDGKNHHERLWENFHSGSRDYALARATERTAFRGAYITDYYKGLPTNTTADLRELFKSKGKDWERQVEKAMCSILNYELSIIGAEAVPIVALGKTDTVPVLLRNYGPDRVSGARHYSRAGGDSYRQEFEALEKTLHLTTAKE